MRLPAGRAAHTRLHITISRDEKGFSPPSPEDPHAEVTLWAYIHGLATLVLDGPPALGAGDEVQRFAHDAIDAPYFTQGTTTGHDLRRAEVLS